MKKLNISRLLLENRILLSIFLVALLLRIAGLFHSLPLLLSGDETSFVRSVLGLRFDPKLNRFDWPHTHFYVNYFFNSCFYYFRVLLQLLGLKDFTLKIIPIIWQDPQIFYVLARFINILMGSLSVIPLYLISKNIFYKNKILWYTPSILLCLIPFHIFDSTQAILDTAMTFWLLFYLFYSINIVNKPNLKNFILAGIFLGLAVGTKYYAIFYSPVLLICSFYSVKVLNIQNIKKILGLDYFKKYLSALLGFIISFFTFNFQIITDFDLFWSKDYGRGFLFQFDNVRSLPVSEYPQNLFRVIFTQPINDLGFALYFVVVVSILLFLLFVSYRNKFNFLFISLVLFTYFYFALKSRNPSHYFVFMYPLLTIIAVDLIQKFGNFILQLQYYFTNFKFSLSRIISFLVGIIVLLSIYPAVKESTILYNPDTRNLLNNWVEVEADKDLKFYYYGDSLLYLPFDKVSEKQITRLDDQDVAVNDTPFYLIIGINNVSYDDLVVKMSHPSVNGWTSKFLKNSDLLLYANNDFATGPPIYVFKVNKVLPK